jgi:hypothetical protein
MPGMKVTLDAAMRARDVSRPHAEHEALAREGEPESGGTREQAPRAKPARPPERTAGAADAAGRAASGGAGNGAAGQGAAAGGKSRSGRSHRRRRHR